MMALEMTEVISVFLTPEEREELQNAVSAFNARRRARLSTGRKQKIKALRISRCRT